MDDATRYSRAIAAFVAAQAGFFLLLAACVALQPAGLWANHGFCYYGEQARTVWVYRLTYLVTGIGLFLAARWLPAQPPHRVVKIAFTLMIPLLLGLVITTSSASALISITHVRIGTSLFVLELLLACWLAVFVRKDWQNTLLLAACFAGCILSLLCLYVILPYFIQAQAIVQLAFGLLVWHSLAVLRPVTSA